MAGADILNKMFKKTSYTMKSPGSGHLPSAKPRLPKFGKSAHFAEGGETKGVPIIAAGGEYVISPEEITNYFGDLDHGHKSLDKWVLNTRKGHIKTLRNLKPPKQ